MSENHMTLEVLHAMFKIGGNVPPSFIEHLTVAPNFVFNQAEMVAIRNLIIEDHNLSDVKDNDAILCTKAMVKFQIWLGLLSFMMQKEDVQQECFLSLSEKEKSEFCNSLDTDEKQKTLFVAKLFDYVTTEFQDMWIGVDHE